MKATTVFLSLILLTLGVAQGQTSYFTLDFPSNKSNFPDNVGSEKVNPGVATGSSSGIYMRFGEDISKLCANYGIPLTSGDPNRFRFPQFRLNVYASQGGFDSVKRLRYEREVQLAMVQSDLRYFALQRAKDELDPKRRDAWRQIGEEIKLLLPLYQEKVHIIVRPQDKPRFKDLAGLIDQGAVVNVGTVSSGGMITCAILEEIITTSRDWKANGRRSWDPRYYGEDAALDMLTGASTTDRVDAVILVGGVPYPVLKSYGVDYAVKKGIFKAGVEAFPKLALLPIGPEAQDIISKSEFRGYHPAVIEEKDYEFLGQSSEQIDTVGVYSSLVTHSAYTPESKQNHKIEWVRHILFRILTKLEPNSEYGLPSDFGVPKAGKKWLEVRPLKGLTSESQWEEYYGWPRHDDPVVRQLTDVWAKDVGGTGGGSSRRVVDPITLF